jgi:hypothetical protein
VKPELTALVHYEEKGSVTNVWGLTTLERPSWLFYVPYIKEYGYPAEFVLQDQKSNIYETAIALPARPGIVRVSLPSTAPALAVNKQYRWYFNIYCDPQKNSPPIYVEGVIQRVNLSQTIAEQLKTATPIKRFAIYAQNGIWYEAVTTLLELRQKNLQDPALQAQWRDLLTSARLDNVATEPIISESGK